MTLQCETIRFSVVTVTQCDALSIGTCSVVICLLCFVRYRLRQLLRCG
jgi:hypothetical protein